MSLNLKISLFIVGVGLLFQSCNDDKNNTITDQTAHVQVKLVDAPGDYLEVNVNIIDLMYNISNDEGEENGWNSFQSFDSEIVDLTELTSGNSLLLADEVLPEGYLSQIRLILDDNGNTIVVEGALEEDAETFPLETPSAQQSGLKLKINETLEGGYSYSFILDWDVQKSIVETGSGKYQLKPVIRAELEINSGIVQGTVTGNLPDDTLESPVAIVEQVVELHTTDSDLTIGNALATTSTDIDGFFLFEGIPPGTYYLIIRNEAFLMYNSEITVIEGIVTKTGTIELLAE